MARDTRRNSAFSGALAQRLLERILDGSWPAGSRLPPERKLAAELSVNRSSLREVLRALEGLRLLEVRRGSGTRVRASEQASLELLGVLAVRDPASAREVDELRAALWPALVELGLARMKTAERAALIERLHELDRAGPDPESLLRAFAKVESELARATRNRAALLLAHSLERFAALPPQAAGVAAASGEPRRLRISARRLALALEARDLEVALAAGRDLAHAAARLRARLLAAS